MYRVREVGAPIKKTYLVIFYFQSTNNPQKHSSTYANDLKFISSTINVKAKEVGPLIELLN